MKKLKNSFLLVLLLTYSWGVQAQTDSLALQQQFRIPKGNFHFGITTGVNNTWIIADNDYSNNQHYKYKTTIKLAPVGLVAGYKFNDRHDVQVEAYLSQQGQDYTITENGDGSGADLGEKRIDLTYLQVPLLFKFTTGDATRFNLHVGPQIGFLIKGQEVNEFPEAIALNDRTLKGEYTLAKKETGDSWFKSEGGFSAIAPMAVLGLGLEKDVKDNLYLSGNMRFNFGFTDIRDTETTTSEYDFDRYTLRYNVFGGVQLGLHYVLD